MQNSDIILDQKNKLKVIFLHIKCQELIYKNANLRMHTKNSKNPPSNVSPGRQNITVYNLNKLPLVCWDN